MKPLFCSPILREGLAPSSRNRFDPSQSTESLLKAAPPKGLRQILFILLFFYINMKTGTDPDSHVTVKEIIIIYCFPRLYRSIILLIVVECENSHPTEAKGRLTCKRGISYQVIQINRNNCRKEITSCDTCMVWVSFCQIFLSQEETSKSAGKWVF